MQPMANSRTLITSEGQQSQEGPGIERTEAAGPSAARMGLGGGGSAPIKTPVVGGSLSAGALQITDARLVRLIRIFAAFQSARQWTKITDIDISLDSKKKRQKFAGQWRRRTFVDLQPLLAGGTYLAWSGGELGVMVRGEAPLRAESGSINGHRVQVYSRLPGGLWGPRGLRGHLAGTPGHPRPLSLSLSVAVVVSVASSWRNPRRGGCLG